MSERKFPWGLLVRVLGVACGLSMVAWLVDLKILWQRVSQISLWILLLALVINTFRQGLTAWRWRLMNTDPDAHSFGQYFLYTLVSAPAQLFVPGIVGVDLARGLLLGQSAEDNHAKHLISVLSDRVIGLLSVLVLGILFALIAPVFPAREKYIGFLLLLMVGFVFAILVAASKWLYGLLSRLFSKLGAIGAKAQSLLDLWAEIVAFFRGHLSRLVWALAACLFVHFSWFLIVYLLAQHLGLGISFFVVVTVTAISWVVLAIPISWMGLGVNELSFIFLLSYQGVAREAAAALSLQLTAVNILFAILCIPLALFVSKGRRTQATG